MLNDVQLIEIYFHLEILLETQLFPGKIYHVPKNHNFFIYNNILWCTNWRQVAVDLFWCSQPEIMLY